MEVKTLKPKVNSSARQSCRLRLNQARPTQPCPEHKMRDRILPPVISFFADEDGRAFYEYVLVASLTVVVGIIVLLALGKGR